MAEDDTGTIAGAAAATADTGAAAGAGAGATAPPAGAATGAAKTEAAKPADTGKPAEAADKGGKAAGTLASGDGAEGDKEGAATWPGDWRERLAGSDEKALNQLKRFSSPEGLWKKIENQEKLIRTKGQKPTKDAAPEDVAAWRKEQGIPDKPEAYIENLKLSGNKVLGDLDKPVAESFAADMHAVGVPQEVVNAGIEWYYKHQEKVATEQANQDAKFKQDARDTLRDDYGADFSRNVNAIGTLFKDAPEGVQDLILAGRASDGRLLGDHPSVIKWLVQVAREANPAATVVLPGNQASEKGVETRIAEIEKMQRTDRAGYFKDEAVQKELRDLYEVRNKLQARGKAA